MQSIASLRASNGVGNASLVTVQSIRSPGASTIVGNTVTGLPPFFIATMGAPHTFTDPVTGETITIISDATAVDFAGHVSGGNIIIDAIAPGYTDTRGSLVGDIVVLKPTTFTQDTLANVLAQSHNDDGSFKADSIVDEVPFADKVDPVKRYSEAFSDYVASGGIITGDAYASTRNASMTALVAYINGQRNAIAAVTARAYTASKDTYVDILNTAGVFTLVYTEVANGAAAPALAANSIRLGKVVTGASNIAAASSIVQTGAIDSLSNPYRPNAPVRGSNIDSSSMLRNIKSVNNTSAATYGNGDNSMSGIGARLTFVCAEPCIALVTVSIGMNTTGDTEFRPSIYLNGAVYAYLSPAAAAASAGNRGIVRGFTFAVPMPAGTNTLDAGSFFTGGTGSYTVPIGGASIAAIVFGKVTA